MCIHTSCALHVYDKNPVCDCGETKKACARASFVEMIMTPSPRTFRSPFMQSPSFYCMVLIFSLVVVHLLCFQRVVTYMKVKGWTLGVRRTK